MNSKTVLSTLAVFLGCVLSTYLLCQPLDAQVIADPSAVSTAEVDYTQPHPKVAGAVSGIRQVIQGGPFEAQWPSLEQYKIPQWYKDAKFGIFIHWGAYSVPAFGSEWYPRQMYIDKGRRGDNFFQHHIQKYGPQKEFGYKDFIPQFKAEKFDAAQWAKLFKDTGARYVIPVAEHHDGFAMYDCAFTKWDSTEMGPKRDVIQELSDAVRGQGMKFGLSSHRAFNWMFYVRSPDFDNADPKYADLYGRPMPFLFNEDAANYQKNFPPQDDQFKDDWLARSCELVDKYKPDVFWFDFGICPDRKGTHQSNHFAGHLKEFAAYYYNQSSKWDDGIGIINYKWNAFPEAAAVYDKERSKEAAIRIPFWQTDTAVSSSSWGFTEDQQYKTPDRLVDDLVDIVSKNGCLLLNVGPRADGTIPEEDQAILKAIGGWLEINGESIYDTTHWKIFGEGPTGVSTGHVAEKNDKRFTPKDLRFTLSGETLYVTGLAWPEDGKVAVTTLAEGGELHPEEIVSVEMLGSDEKLQWNRDANGLNVTLPANRPSEFAYVLKVTSKPAKPAAAKEDVGGATSSSDGVSASQVKPFPYVLPKEKPDQPLSAALERNYDGYLAPRPEHNELFSQFKYTRLKGFDYSDGDGTVSRRDPSKIIFANGKYYVWYTKRHTKTPPQGAANCTDTIPSSDWDLCDIGYATSTDGFMWQEQGIAVARPEKPAVGWRSVSTTDILVWKSKYYLYYQGFMEASGKRGDDCPVAVSYADSPDGPWTPANKIVIPNGPEGAWDQYSIHDPYPIVHDGKIFLYYKSDFDGDPHNVRMQGLAVADDPLGPFVKSPLNPVINSGHETTLFPFKNGIAALVIRDGNEHNTVQFAEDGVNFEVVAHVELMPVAGGPFVADAFTDTKDGRGISWGLSHFTNVNGWKTNHAMLARFDCDLSQDVDDPALKKHHVYLSPEVHFTQGLSKKQRQRIAQSNQKNVMQLVKAQSNKVESKKEFVLPPEIEPSQIDWYKHYVKQANAPDPSAMLMNTDAEPELTEGFTSLFNGTDLTGWVPYGGTMKFEAVNGQIRGTCDPTSNSTYLTTTRDDFTDYIFTCDIKGEVDGNTGVMFRSKTKPNPKADVDSNATKIVYGPQVEMEEATKGRHWSGGIYGQSCGGYFYPLWLKKHAQARTAIKEGWNRVTVSAKGNVIKVWINGVPTSHWVDDGSYPSGAFGLQVHKGKQGTILFKNIMVKEL